MKLMVFLAFVLYIKSVNTEYKTRYKVYNMTKEFFLGPEPRIYNGMRAKENQFPYMIFIIIRYESGIHNSCSASLISPYWVLTAAHCFGNEEFEGVLLVGGKANLRDYLNTRSKLPFNKLLEERFGVQERRAVELFIHPLYDMDTDYYDVALLKLEKPFNSPNIKPIPISTEKMEKPMYCTILGWGLTEDDSKKYTLNYIHKKKAKTTEMGCIFEGPLICLEQGDEGLCKGDSGGPLVCDNKVWGVASYYYGLNDSCENSVEDYYSQIYYSLDWITERSSGNPSIAVNFKNLLVLTCFLNFLTNSLYNYN